MISPFAKLRVLVTLWQCIYLSDRGFLPQGLGATEIRESFQLWIYDRLATGQSTIVNLQL